MTAQGILRFRRRSPEDVELPAGGSLRDVQQLAGHASLQTTQRYVVGNTDAKRRLVAMI